MRAAVRIAADDAALVADRHLLQLAGREAVLLQDVDLRVAVGVGELGDAAGAVDELDVAERDAVHGHVRQRQAADGRIHLAVGAEHVVDADVLPGGLRRRSRWSRPDRTGSRCRCRR